MASPAFFASFKIKFPTLSLIHARLKKPNLFLLVKVSLCTPCTKFFNLLKGSFQQAIPKD